MILILKRILHPEFTDAMHALEFALMSPRYEPTQKHGK